MTLAIPMVDIPAGPTRLLGSLSAKGQPLPLQRVDLLPHRRLTQLQGRRRGQEAPLPGRLTQAPQLLKR